MYFAKCRKYVYSNKSNVISQHISVVDKTTVITGERDVTINWFAAEQSQLRTFFIGYPRESRGVSDSVNSNE